MISWLDITDAKLEMQTVAKKDHEQPRIGVS